MYLTPTERHFACDIEADDLLDKATKIHCVCVENIVTGEKESFTSEDQFRAWQMTYTDAVFVGHNFIAYDAVMLNRFWKARISINNIVDTYVLSQLYSPTLSGGHNLASWGQRVKHPKTEFSDYSTFTPEMLSYCQNDTELSALVFRKLSGRMRQVGFTEEGAELEHLAWHIIQNKQRRTGFPFNKEKAHGLYVQLRAREQELRDEIYRLWPPRLEVVGTYKSAFKRDGTPSVVYERHLGQYPNIELLEGGGYLAYDYVEFSLGSPKQRIDKLLELGWEPATFTKKTDKGGGGNPKVDEDELLSFAETSGNKEVAALAKWIVVNSRANMINTWLNSYDEQTGAIHGKLFLASTLRYRHSNPNSANIPAVRVNGSGDILLGEAGAYTYECRDLWWAGEDEDFVLVGIDAKGIQLRNLAHNVALMVGVEAAQPFIDVVLAGDPHTNNIKTLGLPTKAAAKKFLYTTLMGGGGAKLAADQAQFGLRITEKEGNRLKNLLIDSVPGFRPLIKKLQKDLLRTGRIALCDGTPILVPFPHMVIPYLLQGDESRIMKRTTVYIDQSIREARLTKEVMKVADIHDEYQFKVHRSVVDEFVSMALQCFNWCGESFGYLIPIEGSAKVGRTWASTH